VLVAEWGVDCARCPELLPALDAFVRERADRPVVFVAAHRQGRDATRVRAFLAAHPLKAASVYEDAGFEDAPEAGRLPAFYVVDHRGKVAYSGTDDVAARETVDRLLLDMPAPGQLASGVVWRHFKKIQTKFVLGACAEGQYRRIVEQARRISNPSVVAEANAILAALDADRDELGRRLDEKIAADEARALADLRLYLATWPSRRSAYALRLRELEKKNRKK